MIKYCLGFAKHKNLFVLIRKTHPAFQANKFNGVGGHVEAHENAAEAMTREFYEEVGCVTYEEEWKHKGQIQGSDFVVDIFEIILNSEQFQDIKNVAYDSLEDLNNLDKETEAIFVLPINDIEWLNLNNNLVNFVYEILLSKGIKNWKQVSPTE